jgi:hypothetical protein
MFRAVLDHPQTTAKFVTIATLCFNVIKINYFNVFIFRHPPIKRHLFKNITRYVFMRDLPPAASVFSVLFLSSSYGCRRSVIVFFVFSIGMHVSTLLT